MIDISTIKGEEVMNLRGGKESYMERAGGRKGGGVK